MIHLQSNDPDLCEGSKGNCQSDQGYEKSTEHGQNTDELSLRGKAFKDPSRINERQADGGQCARQPQAESKYKNQSKANTVQRDCAQQDDQGRWTGQQSARDAECQQTAPCDR